MYFFKPQQPILQKKKLSLESNDLALMNPLTVKFVEKLNLCGLYTCIDQAMLIWGLLSGVIFISAQFLPISWMDQAIFWSIMTLAAVISMLLLTYSWTIVEQVTQVVFLWAWLMILGVIITDYAIVTSWGFVLLHLCDLWLMLSGIGYAITGWILHSRAFLLAAIVHSGTTLILPWLSSWQFLVTGLVMMSNLLIFSERQWDMLLPREWKNYSYPRTKSFSFWSFCRQQNQLISKMFRKQLDFVCLYLGLT